MGRKRLYREYDENGNLIKLECHKCGEIKSVEGFYKNKNDKDGYTIRCKECCKEYQIKNKDKIKERYHKYYLDNQDKIKDKSNKYYLNNQDKIHKYRNQNRDKLNEINRKYKINNKDKIQDYGKKYRKQNRDKLNEIIKQWCINNRDKRRKNNNKYIIKKVNKELKKIYENFTKNNYPNNGIQYGIIYGVHCKVTNRWYIGQTVRSFNIRYKGDFFTYKFHGLSEDNPKLQLLHSDIEKYGQENFEIFEVIDVAFSEKELDEKEAYYIDYYKAYDEGYNSNRGNIFKHNKLKRKEVI